MVRLKKNEKHFIVRLQVAESESARVDPQRQVNCFGAKIFWVLHSEHGKVFEVHRIFWVALSDRVVCVDQLVAEIECQALKIVFCLFRNETKFLLKKFV